MTTQRTSPQNVVYDLDKREGSNLRQFLEILSEPSVVQTSSYIPPAPPAPPPLPSAPAPPVSAPSAVEDEGDFGLGMLMQEVFTAPKPPPFSPENYILQFSSPQDCLVIIAQKLKSKTALNENNTVQILQLLSKVIYLLMKSEQATMQHYSFLCDYLLFVTRTLNSSSSVYLKNANTFAAVKYFYSIATRLCIRALEHVQKQPASSTYVRDSTVILAVLAQMTGTVIEHTAPVISTVQTSTSQTPEFPFPFVYAFTKKEISTEISAGTSVAQIDEVLAFMTEEAEMDRSADELSVDTLHDFTRAYLNSINHSSRILDVVFSSLEAFQSAELNLREQSFSCGLNLVQFLSYTTEEASPDLQLFVKTQQKLLDEFAALMQTDKNFATKINFVEMLNRLIPRLTGSSAIRTKLQAVTLYNILQYLPDYASAESNTLRFSDILLTSIRGLKYLATGKALSAPSSTRKTITSKLLDSSYPLVAGASKAERNVECSLGSNKLTLDENLDTGIIVQHFSSVGKLRLFDALLTIIKRITKEFKTHALAEESLELIQTIISLSSSGVDANLFLSQEFFTDMVSAQASVATYKSELVKLCRSILLSLVTKSLLDEKAQLYLLGMCLDTEGKLVLSTAPEKLFVILQLGIARVKAGKSTNFGAIVRSALQTTKALALQETTYIVPSFSNDMITFVAFAFYMLDEEQKKSLISEAIQILGDISKSSLQASRLLSHFVLLLEYWIFHFNSPSSFLAEKVKANILQANATKKTQVSLAANLETGKKTSTEIYYEIAEIEGTAVISSPISNLIQQNSNSIEASLLTLMTKNVLLPTEKQSADIKADADYLWISARRFYSRITSAFAKPLSQQQDDLKFAMQVLGSLDSKPQKFESVEPMLKLIIDRLKASSLEASSVSRQIFVVAALAFLNHAVGLEGSDKYFATGAALNSLLAISQSIITDALQTVNTLLADDLLSLGAEESVLAIVGDVMESGFQNFKTKSMLKKLVNISSSISSAFPSEWVSLVDNQVKLSFLDPKSTSVSASLSILATCLAHSTQTIPNGRKATLAHESLRKVLTLVNSIKKYVAQSGEIDTKHLASIVRTAMQMSNSMRYDLEKKLAEGILEDLLLESVQETQLYRINKLSAVIKSASHYLLQNPSKTNDLEAVICGTIQRLEEYLEVEDKKKYLVYHFQPESSNTSDQLLQGKLKLKTHQAGDLTAFLALLPLSNNENVNARLMTFLSKLGKIPALQQMLKDSFTKQYSKENLEALFIGKLIGDTKSQSSQLVQEKFRSLVEDIFFSDSDLMESILPSLLHGIFSSMTSQRSASEYLNLTAKVAEKVGKFSDFISHLTEAVQKLSSETIPHEAVNFVTTFFQGLLKEGGSINSSIIEEVYAKLSNGNTRPVDKIYVTSVFTVNEEDLGETSVTQNGLFESSHSSAEFIKESLQTEKQQVFEFVKQIPEGATSTTTTTVDERTVDNFALKLSPLLDSVFAAIVKEQAKTPQDKSLWRLSATTLENAKNGIASLKTSYAAGSFNSKLNLERRKELSTTNNNKIARHFSTANYDNYLALVEQQNIIIADMKFSVGDSAPASNARTRVKELSRLAQPFKVLHAKFNPENDRFLASAGVYQCQVDVLNEQGVSVQQVSIYLALEEMPSETCILDIQWLPGSQVLLGVITNQFVKVYDLSCDTFCPVFNYSAPDERIVSACFGKDEQRDVVVLYAMTTSGRIFYQQYAPSEGPCILTEVISLPESCGQNPGHSVFVSQGLNVVIASFKGQGHNYILDIDHDTAKVKTCVCLSNASTEGDTTTLNQLGPLHSFIEIPDFPGVLAAIASNNSVVIFSLSSNGIEYQEIKNGSNIVEGLSGLQSMTPNSRPSLLVYLNNGTLNRYTIQPSIKPAKELTKEARINKVRKASGWLEAPPVTVFDTSKLQEHTNITPNINYKGDILNSYGASDVKNRLNAAANYIVSPSAAGLSLVVENTSSGMAVVGVRVLVGNSAVDNIPTFIEYCGQRVETQPSTKAWYELKLSLNQIPTTKETRIVFGPCHVEGNCAAIDQIEVYGTQVAKVDIEREKLKSQSKKAKESKVVKNLSPMQNAANKTVMTLVKYVHSVGHKTSLIPPLSSVLFKWMMNHRLRDLHANARAALYLLNTSAESALQLRESLIVEYMSKLQISNEAPEQVKFIVECLNSFIDLEPVVAIKVANSNKSLIPELLEHVKSKQSKISTSETVRAIVGCTLLKWRASVAGATSPQAIVSSSKDDFEPIKYFLLCNEESFRSTTGRTLANIIHCNPSFNAEPSKAEDFHYTSALITLLVGIYRDVRNKDVLHTVNYFQLLLELCIRYAKLSNNEEAQLVDLAARLSDGLILDNKVFNIAKRNSDNDIRLLTLQFFSTLLNVKDESNSVKLLKLHTAAALSKRQTEQHLFNLLSTVATEILINNSESSGFSDSAPSFLVPTKEVPPRNFEPLFSKHFADSYKDDLLKPYTKLLVLIVAQLMEGLHCGEQAANWREGAIDLWNKLLSSLVLNRNSPFAREVGKDLMLKLNKTPEMFHEIIDQLFYEEELRDFIKPSEPVAKWSHEKVMKEISKLSQVVQSAEERPAIFAKLCLAHPQLVASLLHLTSHIRNEAVLYPLKLLSISLKSAESPAVAPFFNPDLDLSRMIDKFVLSNNTSIIREATANLMMLLYDASPGSCRKLLFDIILSKLHMLPTYGLKAKEMTWLLKHIVSKYDLELDGADFVTKLSRSLLQILQGQNTLLENHPNSYVYETLQKLVEFNGYYLESKPCLVCNDEELPYSRLGLRDITTKQDTKFDHSSQIIKMKGSYVINKIELDIRDVRSIKMVRSIEIYFNNNPSDELNELKRNNSLWKKAGTFKLQKSQMHAVFDFPVPFTACNLMIKYASMYEDWQTMETLMCSRCKVPVLEQQGNCVYCGENAFTCPKCRNINYDKLDAFLCSSCGHCKYGTYEYSFFAKQSFSTDKIRNEEDQDKALTIIEKELQSCHVHFNDLRNKRSQIISCITSFNEGNKALNAQKINQNIATLASVYSSDTRNTFDALSRNLKVLLNTRREVVRYIESNNTTLERKNDLASFKENSCYGCATHFLHHALSVFQELAKHPKAKEFLSNQPAIEQIPSITTTGGLPETVVSSSTAAPKDIVLNSLIRQIYDVNVRKGSMETKKLARSLVCSLVMNNKDVTNTLESLIMDRVKFCLRNYLSINVTEYLRNDMSLLAELCTMEGDENWESRIKLVMKILAKSMATAAKNLEIAEQVVLPCIKILSNYTSWVGHSSLLSGKSGVSFDNWSSGQISYKQWQNLNALAGSQIKDERLAAKYALKWIQYTAKKKSKTTKPVEFNFVKGLLLHENSQSIRNEMLVILRNIASSGDVTHKLEVLKVLTAMLPKAVQAGESAKQYFSVYSELLSTEAAKYYITVKGFLPLLTKIIRREVEKISAEETQGSYYSVDLNQGFALSYLVNTLVSFLADPGILKLFRAKEENIESVLISFLHLRRLIIQKTKLTDTCYQALNNIITSIRDTEAHRKLFVAACIKALKQFNDKRTASFIFEQLINMIAPAKETPVYQMNLKHVASQQFYFRGNMSGNPYSTKVFKTVADIKDKISTELEIPPAFQLELLVAGKIVNLNLAVVQVFEKIWKQHVIEQQQQQNPGIDVTTINIPPMEVIYRFQGIDGEATEELVDYLAGDEEDANIEEKSKITAVVGRNAGFESVLDIVKNITDFNTDRRLAQLIIQFLFYCTKLKINRRALVVTNAVGVLLSKCKTLFSNSDLTELSELLLLVIKSIVEEATSVSRESASQTPSSPLSAGDSSTASPGGFLMKGKYELNVEEANQQLQMFLDRLPKCSPKIVDAVANLLPFITYGLEQTANHLVEFFDKFINFDAFDKGKSENQFYLNTFAKMVNSIPNDMAGNNLKTLILEKGIVARICKYLFDQFHQKDPSSNEFVKSLKLPSLPFVLDILNGLYTWHSPTEEYANKQEGIAQLLHDLEENLEEKSIATHAETVLNTMHESGFDPAFAEMIKKMREETKRKKKEKAMKKRQNVMSKFLGTAKTAEPSSSAGESSASPATTVEPEPKQKEKQKKPAPKIEETSFDSLLDELEEETGLKCCVCEEGYTLQPGEMLGIYNFMKPVPLEIVLAPYNSSQLASVASVSQEIAVTSVSSFTVIHVNCHNTAAKFDAQDSKKPKTEWEGAEIRNHNIKCNNLLPIKGPKTDEKSYKQAADKYWANLIKLRNIGTTNRFRFVVHDLKILLAKIAKEESLSSDSGGGSTEHNLGLIPFMIQLGLHLLDDAEKTKRTPFEDHLSSFLSSFTPSSTPKVDDSPYYNAVLSLFLMSLEEWNKHKLAFITHTLKQILKEYEAIAPETKKNQFSVLRAGLLFITMLDEIQKGLKTPSGAEPALPIRHDKNSKWVTDLKSRIVENHMDVLDHFQVSLLSLYNKLKTFQSSSQFIEHLGLSLGETGAASWEEWFESLTK